MPVSPYISRMKIKDLCIDERPREKLLLTGARSLSSSELLAVLLRNGSQGSSAVDLARALMKLAEGSICKLFGTSLESMCQLKGMGKCKAATVMAAIELGRRFMSEQSPARKPIVTAKMVYDLMIPEMKALRHEECWVLCLSNANYLLGRYRASCGGTDSTVMDVRQIARTALDKSSSAVILVHNHPSGNPEPSKADIARTESLHKALNAVDIDLLDHVIICDDCYFSFNEKM